MFHINSAFSKLLTSAKFFKFKFETKTSSMSLENMMAQHVFKTHYLVRNPQVYYSFKKMWNAIISHSNLLRNHSFSKSFYYNILFYAPSLTCSTNPTCCNKKLVLTIFSNCTQCAACTAHVTFLPPYTLLYYSILNEQYKSLHQIIFTSSLLRPSSQL
jgi:hypothetical protein